MRVRTWLFLSVSAVLTARAVITQSYTTGEGGESGSTSALDAVKQAARRYFDRDNYAHFVLLPEAATDAVE